jgi:pyruvate-formate lyase-activating enzyme
VVLSPQGFGPARNIVAFTGGDIACRANFYAQAAEKIKARCWKMWVLLETNGYGLTPENLDILAQAGLDAFWLDIKAYDEELYRKLCGTTNDWILKAPAEILKRGFTLEVLTLFIPGWVETGQIARIASLICQLDEDVPFTILAFFPAFLMADSPRPTLSQMLEAYNAVKEVGLRNVKLGNYSVFAQTDEDWDRLLATVGPAGIG